MGSAAATATAASPPSLRRLLFLAASASVSYLGYRRATARRRGTAVRIGIVGDIFMDVVVAGIRNLPQWGQDELTSSPISIMPGGGGLNSALQISGMIDKRPFSDLSVELHSLIGNDRFGGVIQELANKSNLKLIYPKTKVRTGSCVCLSGGDEGKIDRAFVTYRGAMAEFNGEHLDTRRLKKSNHVHVAGYYNFPKMWPKLESLVPELNRLGVTVSLNPQWDASNEWKGLPKLYKKLDVLILNQDEAKALSKKGNLGDALQFFHDKGVSIVVITIGPHGAVASTLETITKEKTEGQDEKVESKVSWHWQKPVAAHAVDTTGAGDAFTGGFLFEWTRSKNIPAALQLGCALGSAMVTKLGASAEITREDIEKYTSESIEDGSFPLSGSPSSALQDRRIYTPS